MEELWHSVFVIIDEVTQSDFHVLHKQTAILIKVVPNFRISFCKYRLRIQDHHHHSTHWHEEVPLQVSFQVYNQVAYYRYWGYLNSRELFSVQVTVHEEHYSNLEIMYCGIISVSDNFEVVMEVFLEGDRKELVPVFWAKVTGVLDFPRQISFEFRYEVDHGPKVKLAELSIFVDCFSNIRFRQKIPVLEELLGFCIHLSNVLLSTFEDKLFAKLLFKSSQLLFLFFRQLQLLLLLHILVVIFLPLILLLLVVNK